MWAWSQTYSYFVSSVALLGICAMGLKICPRRLRRTALLGGVLGSPFALYSPFFVPEYWNPTVVVRLGRTTVEDIIFSFSTGGIVWSLVCVAFPRRLMVDMRPSRTTLRYLLCFVGVAILSLLPRSLGLGVMSCGILGLLMTGLLLVGWHPGLRPLAVSGLVGFTALYFAYALASFWFKVGAIGAWNLQGLWGLYVFGVPLEEFAWSAAYGAAWPMFMACVLEVRLLPPAAPTGDPEPDRCLLRANANAPLKS